MLCVKIDWARFHVFDGTRRHPDKTDNPKAEDTFVEIKKAYELLADTDRRKAYDRHGITNEDAKLQRGSQHDYSQYGRFAPDPFQEFFGYEFAFHFMEKKV